MRSRLWFFLTTFIVVIMLVSFVMANDARRVLILARTMEDPTAIRMRDELGVLGFDVEIQQASSDATHLAEIGQTASVAAAAYIEPWPAEIILWVRDGENPQQTLRVSESLEGEVDPELLALRAVELLRGRLLPVPAAPQTSASAPTPTIPSINASAAAPSATISSLALPNGSAKSFIRPKPPIQPQTRAFSAFVGPALLTAPAGMSASAHAALSARYTFSRISAETWAFLPINPSVVQNADGRVDLRMFVLGAGLDALISNRADPLAFSIGAGAGPVLLWFEGQAEPPRIAASDTRIFALVYGRAGIAYRLHPRLRLRLDALVGPILPEPIVRIAGNEVTSVGRPVIFLSFGAEVQP